jgi:hypothetical protein
MRARIGKRSAANEYDQGKMGMADIRHNVRRSGNKNQFLSRRQSPEQFRSLYSFEKKHGQHQDIKTLQRVNEDKLEQWYPIMKAEFPLTREILGKVFLAWKTEAPAYRQETYSYDEFLIKLVQPHPDLKIVKVDKERHGFMINGCIVEIADLKFDGKPLRTIAVEMEDPGQVMATVKELQLVRFENVNYLKALKRFTDMDVN